MADFTDFIDGDTEGQNVNIVDSSDPTKKARVISDPDGIDRLQTSAYLDSGQLVPTITNKLRIHTNIGDIALASDPTYTTLYTRNGTGLFFGFQVGFDSASVKIRLTIDGGQVFDLLLDDIRSLQFNDTTTTRVQMGGFLTTIGNVLDFSSRFAIPYETSVLIEATSATGSRRNKNYIVFLTEDS